MNALLGAYVRLKSGGPLMKIVAVRQSMKMAECRWKDEHGILCAGEFRFDSLRVCRRPKK